MSIALACPKCGADVTDAAIECPSCGVILAKARAAPKLAPTPEAPAPPPPEPVAEGRPADLANPYKLRRGDQDFDVPNLATLQEWARIGRIAPTDYVYNPTLERWMYAREVGELEGEIRGQAKQAQAKHLNKLALACFLGSLLTGLWAPTLSGLLFIACIVLLVVNYAKR